MLVDDLLLLLQASSPLALAPLLCPGAVVALSFQEMSFDLGPVLAHQCLAPEILNTSGSDWRLPLVGGSADTTLPESAGARTVDSGKMLHANITLSF